MAIQERQVRLLRRDGHDIRVGIIIGYHLEGLPFEVFAHRIGIEVRGKTPALLPSAVNALKLLLDRAILQHNELASTAVGEKQTPIDEHDLDIIMGLKPPDAPRPTAGPRPVLFTAKDLPHVKN